MSLVTKLQAAGLTVRTAPGWATRGAAWGSGGPAGVMQHHTAAPVPFPVERLYGALNKCNINTKPDGTVWLLVGKACNFSSGPGMQQVLDEVRTGTPPTENARDRGWDPDGSDDDTDGNPWFFNFENDHLGDGSPIPQVQLDAIVVATRVVLDHYDLTGGNVISHAEWTARKSDPYWNSNRRCIEEIRANLEEDMVSRKDKADDGNPALAPAVAEMIAAGVFSEHTQPGGVAFNDEIALFLSKFEEHLKVRYGLGSLPPGTKFTSEVVG